jgi:two-component system, LuxR family, sensor kinase FixL
MPSLDPRDLAALEALATVGEIVGPVTHEFNNLLNTLLLQIAVLEQAATEAQRKDLATLKQYAKVAAALVRQVQQYRRQAPPEPHPGDLSAAAAAAVAAVRAGPLPPGVTVEFTPGGDLPPVRGGGADLRRLLTFLLTNAVLSGGGQVIVRTEPRGSGGALVLELAGPSADPAFVARLTAPNLNAQDGAAGLELAAARSLVRRLGGELIAEQTAAGGARVVVELRAG